MQNMRIGDEMSSDPVDVKFRRPDRCPSWKIHTIAPNVAVRLRKLRTSAFSGTSRLPNIRKSITNVERAMSPIAIGSRPKSVSFASTSCADEPPTRTSNCELDARMRSTSASASSENGSTDGITWNHVAPAAANRADSNGAGGRVRTPL